MSDDMKLSIDISADLTKLDGTLAAAQAKVQAAGQSMQRAVTFGPTYGGGYAQLPAAGVPFSGAGGGGMGGGGSLPPAGGAYGAGGGNFGLPAAGRVQVSYARVVGPPGGGFGGGGGGGMLPPAGGFGGGGQGNPGGGGWGQFVNPFIQQSIANGRSWINKPGNLLRLGAGVEGIAAAAKGVEQLEYAGRNNGNPILQNEFSAGFENVFRSIPLVGGLWGSALDSTRSAGRVIGDLFGGNKIRDFFSDPASSASAASQALDQSRILNAGFKGGGTSGKLRDIQFERDNILPMELERMRASGADSDTRGMYESSRSAVLSQQYAEVKAIDFPNEMNAISSATRQSQMRISGMGLQAGIEEIRQSYATQLRTLSFQPGEENRQLERALVGQRNSAIAEYSLNSLKPVTSVSNPLNEAVGVGSVSIGSMSGQDPNRVRAFLAAASGMGAGTSSPVVASAGNSSGTGVLGDASAGSSTGAKTRGLIDALGDMAKKIGTPPATAGRGF